jgi:hypothetical protein
MMSSGEMVELILSRDESIRITQRALEAAVPITQEYSLLKLLLDRGGDDIKITEEILKVVAQKSFVFIMQLLLHRGGKRVQITEDVLRAAANNRYDSEMLLLLLDQAGENIQLPQDLSHVAANDRLNLAI